MASAQDLAQNDYEDFVENILVLPFESSASTAYFLAIREVAVNNWVTDMQKEVAEYTFVPTAEHDKDELYKVIFGTENSSVVANYTGEGRLVETFETYHFKNVPQFVQNTIHEKFGNAEILNGTYKVTYKEGEETFKRFIAQISINGKTQNVKMDLDGNLL